MTRFILAAGVAALAISAPVGAKPGEGGGHGGGNKGQSAKADRGGGAMKAQHGGGGFKAAKVERRGGGQQFREFRPRRQRRHAQQVFERRRQRQVAKFDRGNRHDIVRVRDLRGDNRFDTRFASRGLIDGCPPGLGRRTMAACLRAS